VLSLKRSGVKLNATGTQPHLGAVHRDGLPARAHEGHLEHFVAGAGARLPASRVVALFTTRYFPVKTHIRLMTASPRNQI
jgi:hypothetical protein